MTQTVQQLSPALIEELLAENCWNLAGKMMRLALWAGLTRRELMALTWEQITPSHIVLPQRQIPLEPQLSAYLSSCPGHHTGACMRSQRTHEPVTPQGASHALRAALNECGAQDVSLWDFRREYIIAQLQTNSVEEVGRRTGMRLLTLSNGFGDFIPETTPQAIQTIQIPRPFPRAQLQVALQTQPRCAAALALQLAWEGGLAVQTMATITWEALSPELKEALGWNGDCGYVLVGPRAGKPLLPSRISRITREFLVANGLDDVHLRDLIADYHQRQNGIDEILDYVHTHQRTTALEISQALAMDKQVISRQLLRLVQQGRIVRVGMIYYQPGQVVPPEQHQHLLESHLQAVGSTFRKDVVELLGVTPNQASIILKNWVNQGLLVQKGQIYYLANGQRDNITIV